MLVVPAFAEDSPPPAATPENSAPAEKAEKTEKADVPKGSSSNATVNESAEKKERGSSRLRDKLTRDGKVATLGILAPIDYTTLNFSETAQGAIVSNIGKYGEFPVRTLDDALLSLTIDDFRKIVTKNKVDLVLVLILKPTNFDMFLFDKKNPYAIYAHSETLPEQVQYQLTKEVVEEYSKVILRRILYAYLQDQYYELPRQETSPVLTTEIPRWVASNRSLVTVNREILSSFYASAGVGAALAMGNGKMWNSNVVGVTAGFRLMSSLFIEANVDLFAYNAFGAGVKYLANNLDSPFRFGGGLGIAMLNTDHTLNYDQTHSQGAGGMYVVPSAIMLFPIVDIHFKVEGKIYVGMGNGMIFSLMPGFTFFF